MAEKVYFEQYDNIYKFMDIIDNRSENEVFKGKNESKKHGEKDWFGTNDYEEALQLFASGIPEKADKLTTSLNRIKNNASANSPKRMPKNYYYGYAPNIPAAIIGLPKSMKRVEHIPQKIKAVSIYYDCTMNAGTSGSELEKAGETVLQLVYMLEVQGYRVALNQLCFGGNKHNETAYCSILLKDWKQHFDLLKLSFPLTSPAMFRRFGFRWIETQPDITDKDWRFAYGRHVDKNTLIKHLEQQHINTNTSYIVTVPDCERADFNAEELGKDIGLIK